MDAGGAPRPELRGDRVVVEHEGVDGTACGKLRAEREGLEAHLVGRAVRGGNEDENRGHG
jgi:hypothetical protein